MASKLGQKKSASMFDVGMGGCNLAETCEFVGISNVNLLETPVDFKDTTAYPYARTHPN